MTEQQIVRFRAIGAHGPWIVIELEEGLGYGVVNLELWPAIQVARNNSDPDVWEIKFQSSDGGGLKYLTDRDGIDLLISIIGSSARLWGTTRERGDGDNGL